MYSFSLYYIMVYIASIDNNRQMTPCIPVCILSSAQILTSHWLIDEWRFYLEQTNLERVNTWTDNWQTRQFFHKPNVQLKTSTNYRKKEYKAWLKIYFTWVTCSWSGWRCTNCPCTSWIAEFLSVCSTITVAVFGAQSRSPHVPGSREILFVKIVSFIY